MIFCASNRLHDGQQIADSGGEQNPINALGAKVAWRPYLPVLLPALRIEKVQEADVDSKSASTIRHSGNVVPEH